MKTFFSILTVAILFSGCGPTNPGVSPWESKKPKTSDCSSGKTKLDGVCVSNEVADYVSCVRAQGATLGSSSNKSLSVDVGYFGINAGGANEVSEKLEKKYTTSDKAMMEIIKQCNKLAGIASE